MENVPLSGYSTMRLGGPAAYLAEVHSVQEVAEAVAWAEEHRQPLVMIGEGSNIIWPDEGFKGLVLVNKIAGFELKPFDEQTAYVEVGGGENWDSVVERVVVAGYSGIESLSLIPGTAGSAPVQNIGAYGQELSQTLTTVQAYDLHERKMVTLRASECGFGYRTSRFKATDRGRFLITSITLCIRRASPQPPFYKDVEAYFKEHPVSDYTAQAVRQAVIAIRTAKLPDPANVANCGSFFQNPVISRDELDNLLEAHPELAQADPKWPQKPYWVLDDNRVKLSAARLMELAGFNDTHDAETGIGQWPRQNLILVNEKATTTTQLLAFKQKIVDAVQQKFGITLEQEPELMTS